MSKVPAGALSRGGEIVVNDVVCAITTTGYESNQSDTTMTMSEITSKPARKITFLLNLLFIPGQNGVASAVDEFARRSFTTSFARRSSTCF
jgi:hypothetical protein